MPLRWPWQRRSLGPMPTRVASVQPLTEEVNRLLRMKVTLQPWQEQARMYGRTLGVVRFAFGMEADACSRCPIVPEYLVDPVKDRWEPQDDPFVASVMQGYRNEREDTPELIRRHAWQYELPGELYQSVEDRGQGTEWFLWSQPAVEIRAGGAEILVKELPGGSVTAGGARLVPPEQVRRFWRPDHDWPLLAQSPMQGILDDCERYTLLGRRTKKEARSALGLNGLLHLPNEAHQYPIGPDGRPSRYSRMEQDLMAVAQAAWDDDASPAAVMPFLTAYGNGSDVKPPTWVQVGRMLDPTVMAARAEALDSIARGLPMPKAIVTGESAVHWNLWLFDEQWVRGPISTLLERIHHGDLTQSVLRPSLRAAVTQGRWAGDPQRWRVGFDTVPITVHPDKADRAIQLYGKGALSLVSLLTETGFGSEDAPSAEELARFVAVQQALNSRPQEAQPVPSVTPATTRELPPAPAMAGLTPFPDELSGWLD